MDEFAILGTKREKNAKDIRKEGAIPGIVYGKKFNNIPLLLQSIAFNRLYKEAGSSNLVELDVEGEKIKALIQDVQIDPISGRALHVDFLKVDMKEKIKTEIPLEFIGETPLIIQEEGSLMTNKDTLEIECLPADLVDHIDVDISVLTDFEQNIKVSDIKVPQGIEVLDDAEEVVALVQPPRSEEELAELEEAVEENVDAVEVEQGGTEPEAEGAEGEAAPEGEDEKPAAEETTKEE